MASGATRLAALPDVGAEPPASRSGTSGASVRSISASSNGSLLSSDALSFFSNSPNRFLHSAECLFGSSKLEKQPGHLGVCPYLICRSNVIYTDLGARSALASGFRMDVGSPLGCQGTPFMLSNFSLDHRNFSGRLQRDRHRLIPFSVPR